MIKNENLERIDFLKCDIEGSEFDLFMHDNSWLRKIKRIAMEVHPDFGNVADLVDILKVNNFKIQLINLGGKTVPEIISSSGGYLFAESSPSK